MKKLVKMRIKKEIKKIKIIIILDVMTEVKIMEKIV